MADCLVWPGKAALWVLFFVYSDPAQALGVIMQDATDSMTSVASRYLIVENAEAKTAWCRTLHMPGAMAMPAFQTLLMALFAGPFCACCGWRSICARSADHMVCSVKFDKATSKFDSLTWPALGAMVQVSVDFHDSNRFTSL